MCSPDSCQKLAADILALAVKMPSQPVDVELDIFSRQSLRSGLDCSGIPAGKKCKSAHLVPFPSQPRLSFAESLCGVCAKVGTLGSHVADFSEEL